MTAQEHYENHLADFYEWMIGDFDTRQKEQQNFFESNQIISEGNSTALDLGAGNGIQTISLAKLGFSVKAFDFNEQLLLILKNRSNDLDIEPILCDLLSFKDYADEANVIVCMGDTIAHMDSLDQLKLLFKECESVLKKKGKLILSYRDYSTELKDTQRFIPVKSDDDKILTCILEYNTNKVKVTDLLYEKTQDGWKQKVSSYFKLRLTPQMVEKLIMESGLKICKIDIINRMNYVIAEKHLTL